MSLKQNTYVAVGDIHGCAASLERLMEKMDQQWGTNPIYVFLGDYTDRGPESKKAVDLLLKFEDTHQCIFIRGNHDQMLLNAYRNGEWIMWLRNGGENTLKSYEGTPDDFHLPEDHYEFFSQTKLWWETPNYLFVHGGINPNKTVRENLDSKTEQDRFIWQRDHIYSSTDLWEKKVVFGHTPVKTPIVENNKIGIDTGCVYKEHGMGILSSVSLPELDFITQRCLDL